MTPVPDSDVDLPGGVKRLVWFVDHWSPATERPPGLVEIEIPHGRYLYVLPLGRRPVEYAGYTLVASAQLSPRVGAPRASGRDDSPACI